MTAYNDDYVRRDLLDVPGQVLNGRDVDRVAFSDADYVGLELLDDLSQRRLVDAHVVDTYVSNVQQVAGQVFQAKGFDNHRGVKADKEAVGRLC